MFNRVEMSSESEQRTAFKEAPRLDAEQFTSLAEDFLKNWDISEVCIRQKQPWKEINI
jgi:hypothetical protein